MSAAAPRRRRWVSAGGAGLAALALAAGLTSCAGSADDLGEPAVDRVLVVSLPGVGWEDVRNGDLPNLERFVADAAIGDLSTRIGKRDAAPTDAYLSISAGTRALAPVLDRAVALDPDESYGGVPAEELVARRRGEVPPSIFYLAIGAALDLNTDSAFGAEVGMLGDQLDDVDVARAVIANADASEGFVSDDPPPEGAYARGAATALMDSQGLVPEGRVGRSLLMDDPEAPFGRRLDPDAVLGELDMVWDDDDRVVALVEASDLSRAAAYEPRATAEQRRVLRDQALADADALLDRVLERVDPARDAVLVLSPVAPGGAAALGVTALRAPGVESGLLESATTRRAGYVQLADVMPTILTLLGEETPDEIEGRSFQVVDAGRGGTSGRVERLADEADAATFRDGLLPLLVVSIIAVLALLALATVRRHQLPARFRPWLTWVAYGVLGLVPATFLVGRLGVAQGSVPVSLVAMLAIGGAVAVAATRVERRWAGGGAILAVGLIVAVVAIDVIAGAPLQLNTVFGYSAGVAGRFAGLGNLAFALFGSATVLLAVLVAERGGQRGLHLALALLVVIVLVEGLPMFGADVGGVVAMVPAFGITALVLAGHRVGLREAAALVAATTVALLAFAFIDAARAPQKHTHLARLAEHVVDGRWGPFFDSLNRRWQASLGGAEVAGWITVIAVLVAAGTYVVLLALGRVGNPERVGWDRWRTAGAAGLAVLALVGLVANDSSIAVPATMLIVAAPVAVLRSLREPLGVPR